MKMLQHAAKAHRLYIFELGNEREKKQNKNTIN